MCPEGSFGQEAASTPDSAAVAGHNLRGEDESGTDDELDGENEDNLHDASDNTLGASYSTRIDRHLHGIYKMIDMIVQNRPLNDMRILPSLDQALSGMHDLVDRIEAKETAVNSARQINPTTFNKSNALVMFFRTRSAARICAYNEKMGI